MTLREEIQTLIAATEEEVKVTGEQANEDAVMYKASFKQFAYGMEAARRKAEASKAKVGSAKFRLDVLRRVLAAMPPEGVK